MPDIADNLKSAVAATRRIEKAALRIAQSLDKFTPREADNILDLVRGALPQPPPTDHPFPVEKE